MWNGTGWDEGQEKTEKKLDMSPLYKDAELLKQISRRRSRISITPNVRCCPDIFIRLSTLL